MWDWAFHSDALTWSVRLLHICALGQTLFVVLWLSLPWWRSWVGRALMVKSFALMVLFDEALLFYYLPPWRYEVTLGVLLFSLVTLGVYSQLFAIVVEAVRGRRQNYLTDAETKEAPDHME